ncbi:MAG: hypothetical protein WAW61_10200 [Methylococcaceae bacterium]
MANLSAQHIKTIKDAAKKLTGAKRRAFQAQVAIDYLNLKKSVELTSAKNIQHKLDKPIGAIGTI